MHARTHAQKRQLLKFGAVNANAARSILRPWDSALPRAPGGPTDTHAMSKEARCRGARSAELQQVLPAALAVGLKPSASTFRNVCFRAKQIRTSAPEACKGAARRLARAARHRRCSLAPSMRARLHTPRYSCGSQVTQIMAGVRWTWRDRCQRSRHSNVA